MILLLFLSLILVFLLAKPKLHLNIQSDEPWLSRQRTAFVNGFFIILVFLRHIQQYQLNISHFEEHLLLNLLPGQLIVTSFFFFSGYGLMHSIKAKGKPYVRSIIQRRFPSLLVNFSVAVILFVALQAFLGHTYSLCHILLSLPGWESVGNSNWFICMTLLAYLFIFLSFSLVGPQRPYLAITLIAVLSILGSSIILQEKEAAYWWVDTYLCIPAGMLFALLKERMEQFFAKTHIPAISVGLCLLLAGYFLYINTDQVFWHLGIPTGSPRLPAMMIGSILFVSGLTIIYGCLSFHTLPPFMVWLGGTALFPMYICQRIPMLVGYHFGFNQNYTAYYIAGCFLVSILLAACFQKVFGWLNCWIFLQKHADSPNKLLLKHHKNS